MQKFSNNEKLFTNINDRKIHFQDIDSNENNREKYLYDIITDEIIKFNGIMKSNIFCDSFSLTALELSNNKHIITNNQIKILSNVGFSTDLIKGILDVIEFFVNF